MRLGERLNTARKSIGYTLSKVYQESGISESALSDFENAKREPKFSQLSRLAEIYRRSVEFFLSDEPIVDNVMIWRDQPASEESRAQVEAEFRQLCQQYRNLENILGEADKGPRLPEASVTKPEEFCYSHAEYLAKYVQNEMRLGDIPIASLKRILEEVYYIKIFYLEFEGSAISTVSPVFGPAILLNAKNKQWRRSYDLAHELFHILTWKIFGQVAGRNCVASQKEEQLADAFASRLLMPEESIKDRVKASVNSDGEISLSQLDDIAREFDVSLLALVYRLGWIYRKEQAEMDQYRQAVERYVLQEVSFRQSFEPNKLPQRYCDLAVRALVEGRLSLLQFAKYMGISYAEAQKYLVGDGDFKDEKIQFSVA
jgi:Zn-dependent peptidase ImmA (M78 family)/transcriptional regulator with XRE-family HTH domain